jgi:hypothetical protein
MVSKSAKSKSKTKTKKKGPRASAKARARAKKQLALKEARAQLKALKSAFKQLQTHLKSERSLGHSDPVAIQADISNAQIHLEKVQLELRQAKDHSSKRKDEIDEWKVWYDRLPEEHKPSGLVNLQNEIAWRAGELDTNADKIDRLILEEIHATGAMESAKHRLSAHADGAHKLPIDKDPRMKAIQKRIKTVQVKINRLKKKK